MFLTLFGDNTQIGQPVVLKLYDTDLGIEIPQTSAALSFAPDALKGTVPNPFDLVIDASGVDRLCTTNTSLVCYQILLVLKSILIFICL